MCTFFHVCFFICSSSKWLTGRPRAICGQRYPLPCFAWLWIGMRGSKEVALIGMKSCRTQGDFCLFVVCLSIHQSPPGPLRPEICPLRPEICPHRPEICPLRPWIGEGRLRPERTGFRPERADSRPEKTDSRPERADFRPKRAWGGQTDGRTNEQTNKRKSPCVLQAFIPFGAAAQKSAVSLNWFLVWP